MTPEPLIGQIIPEQGFEVVANQIGAILLLELTNQKTLGAFTEDFNLYKENTVPTSSADSVTINVHLDSSVYADHTQSESQGRTLYYIDIDTSGAEEEGTPGSQISAERLHRFMGMVMFIFRSSFYRTMSLPAGFIGGTYVQQFKTLDPNRREDTDFTCFARIVLAVRIQEVGDKWAGVGLIGNNTSIKLDHTEKGYKFVFNNNN